MLYNDVNPLVVTSQMTGDSIFWNFLGLVIANARCWESIWKAASLISSTLQFSLGDLICLSARMKNEGVVRRFYISHLHDTCPGDIGWMFVMDTDHNLTDCPGWELDLEFNGTKRRVTKSDLPQFLYCSPPFKCMWSKGKSSIAQVTSDHKLAKGNN